MKFNQKDAMQIEDEESIRQCKITFQKKTKEFFFCCSRQCSADHDVIHNTTEQRMSFISADTTNHHFLYFLAVGSLSNTVALCLSPLVGACLYWKYMFALLCNDTLLYSKPAYHHSCWLTQRCQMFQAQEKPSEFLLWKNSSCWRLSRCHNVADLSILTVS